MIQSLINQKIMKSRRKFLQNITASVIAIPFLSKNKYLESFNDGKDRSYDGPVLRVAIMGLGSYGTRVADAITINKIVMNFTLDIV